MKKFLLFILLASSLSAEEVPHIPINTYRTIDVKPSDLKTFVPLATHLQVPAYCPKVNVVTGEYAESEEDLVVAGCQPLSFRRFYNHLASPDQRYGSWYINPETTLIANFDWDKSALFSSVGTENGGLIYLDEKKIEPLDEHLKQTYGFPAACCFSLSASNNYGYTNTAYGEIGGGTNPRNTKVAFWKSHPKEKTFAWLGIIYDGSGSIKEFASAYYEWHKRKEVPASNSNYGFYFPQNFWIPYHIPIQREILPNGNVIRYEYTNWKEDKYFPSPGLLLSIKVYNHDETLLMGKVDINYTPHKWKHTQTLAHAPDGEALKYKENVVDIAHFSVLGSDQRAANFYNTQRDKSSVLVYLQDAKTPQDQISYRYLNTFLTEIDRGNGRIFKTEYDWNTQKVAAQYGPVGPNGEMVPVGRFVYQNNRTTVYDAQNNPTHYHFDDKKRVTAIEKTQNGSLYSVERNVWDDQGRLLSVSVEDTASRVFQKVAFKYDEKGNVLEKVVSGVGASDYKTTYTYSKEFPYFNLKESESDGRRIIRYKYKPKTNLVISEWICEGDKILKRTFYTYDNCAICIKKIEDDGYSENEGDLSGITYRAITYIKPRYSLPCFGLAECVEEKSIDESGQEILLKKVLYSYHPSGKIKREDHYDAHNVFLYSSINEYDEKERLKSTTDALGQQTTLAYDANHNLIALNGPKTQKRWEYDKADRPIVEKTQATVIRKKYDRLSRLIELVDECQNSTRYEYDSLGRVVQIFHPDGGVEKKEYDILGNVTKEIDPNGYETQKEYNYKSQPLYIRYPDGSKEYYVYNPQGTLKEHTDKNGVKTTYTYDLFDHPVKTEVYVDGDLVKETRATYSPFCKLSETDADGITTEFKYDFAGRKISERRDSREIHYKYDELGRLTRTQMGDILYIEEFDLLDRLIEKRTEVLSGLLVFKENYGYDENGNRTTTITCNGSSEIAYNDQNLPIRMIAPDGHVTNISYSYESLFKKTTIDPDGIEHVEIYDPCKRLKQRQVKNSKKELIQHSEFIFDSAGNRTDAIEYVYEGTKPIRTIENKWEYGPLGRIEKLIESGQKETRYLYDTKGRLQTIGKPDGSELHHHYDGLGRLVNVTSSKKDIDYLYSYDRQDRVIAINGLLRTFDIFGNLIEEQLENGKTIKSSYDAYGRRRGLTLNGTTVKYAYQADQLVEILYNGLSYIYKERNLAAKPTEIALPNHLGELHFSYDACLRPKEIRSPYFTAQDYCYNSNGNLIHYRFTDALGPIDADYTYDALSQLTTENAHQYEYDSLYNRIVDNKKSCLINDFCQITHDGTKEYRYDANGNLIQLGDTYLAYDSLNRLVKVQKEGKTYEYGYDGLNRRISKKTPTKTIYYLWDDKKEIGSNDELRILGEGLGAEIGASCFITLNKQTYIPIHDHRGALITLIDLKGNPAETYRYSAFGEELTLNHLSPWRFSSKRTDDETGFVYFGKRFYIPSLGRWITPDPLGFEDGPNLYAYVQNCPLLGLDLYGEWAIWNGLGYGTKVAFQNCFPALYHLNHLPSDTSMWKRAGLTGLAAFEIVSSAIPASKLGLSLAERSVYQIGSAALSREAMRKGAQHSAEKMLELTSKRKVFTKGLKAGEKSLRGLENKSVADSWLKLDLDALSRAGQVMDLSGLTKAGRALDKHDNRMGSIFPKATGNAAAKNSQGQFHLDDILTDPRSMFFSDAEKNGFKIYSSKGKGAYFRQDGTFRGFIEHQHE